MNSTSEVRISSITTLFVQKNVSSIKKLKTHLKNLKNSQTLVKDIAAITYFFTTILSTVVIRK